MTDVKELQSLLERVEKAEGPCNLLDRDIALAMGWRRELDRNVYAPHHEPPYYWHDPDGYGHGHRDGDTGPEEFTRSIDAAVALVERMLPGAKFTLTKRPIPYLGDHPFETTIWGENPIRPSVGASAGFHKHGLALALCAALLRALIASAPLPPEDVE